MFQLKTEIYLDKRDKCYKKIIIIDPIPNDPKIKCILRQIRKEKLSPFDQPTECCSSETGCMSAFINPSCTCDLLCIDKIGGLFSYLVTNGYKINTSVTKIMLKGNASIPNLICFIEKN
jgi:hypothetical protein